MSNFGTTAQAEYAIKLAVRAGFKTLEAAIEDYSGRPTVVLAVTPFTKDEASKVITWLERRLGVAPKPAKASTTDAPSNGVNGHANEDGKSRARYLTARHLRLIATHQEAPPAELDDDARWVLARLHRLAGIEAFVSRGAPDMPTAVNGNEQIKVTQLVDYFGSEEHVADAFAVSIGTLRAWGNALPPVHAFKAEVLTNGFVRVPRG